MASSSECAGDRRGKDCLHARTPSLPWACRNCPAMHARSAFENKKSWRVGVLSPRSFACILARILLRIPSVDTKPCITPPALPASRMPAMDTRLASLARSADAAGRALMDRRTAGLPLAPAAARPLLPLRACGERRSWCSVLSRCRGGKTLGCTAVTAYEHRRPLRPPMM